MRTIAIAILPLAVCASCGGSGGGSADSDTVIEVETRMVMPNAPMPDQQDTIAVPRQAPASPPAAEAPKKRDKAPAAAPPPAAETPPQAVPADSTAH